MWRWLEEMEVFLQADIAGFGDIDTLEAQLAESNVNNLKLSSKAQRIEKLNP